MSSTVPKLDDCRAEEKPELHVVNSSSDPQKPDIQKGLRNEVTSKTELGEADAFRPPFPHRLDLFSQPDASTALMAVQQRVTSSGEQVTLKGFVHVDQIPRAMLLLEGKLWLAASGDERGEVAVIEISPPEVTLRRQGVEWSMSLQRSL